MKRQRSDDDNTDQLLDDFGLDELLKKRMLSTIDNELLESLKEILNRLDSRRDIVAFASQFIETVTEPSCDHPLVLTLETHTQDTFTHPTERIRGQTFRILIWLPFPNDEYLVLNSKGDLLSKLGIGAKTYDNSPLEITSDTPKRQRRRRYNTILRSVAVIIGCREESGVKLEPVNWISAYALFSTYHTTHTYIRDEIKNPPMKHEEARSYAEQNSKSIKEIVISPSKENFDIATEILFKTTIECYNSEPEESGA